MKTYREFRARSIIPRLPLIVAAIAGIACSDSTAPSAIPARYRVTLNRTSAVVGLPPYFQSEHATTLRETELNAKCAR